MKKYLILMVMVAGLSLFGNAQKVGWTNVELLLAYLPETEQMETKLATLEKAALEQLEIKQKYYQQKLLEYMELKEAGKLSDAMDQAAQQELTKLQGEIQEGAKLAELKLVEKRMELLGPIQEKMQKAIDDTAKELGYTYILNNAMGSGIPTILFGKAEDDVTEAIANKLGIETEE